VESKGAYRRSPSIHSDTSYTGEISDTESGEDDDLILQGQKGVGDNKLTPGLDGYDQSSCFVRHASEGSVAPSIDTMRSTPLGQGGRKAVTQPPGILKEQKNNYSHHHAPSFEHST